MTQRRYDEQTANASEILQCRWCQRKREVDASRVCDECSERMAQFETIKNARKRLEALCQMPYHMFLSERRTDAEYEAYRVARGFKTSWTWHAKRSAAENNAWRNRRFGQT